MKNGLNRRDFLRLAGLLPLGLAAPRAVRGLNLRPQTGPRNVILMIFDAFSAYDISLYGFDRQTTPNLARLTKRAVVYYNHFAAGNFTSPGTASLLTGVLPWTHRALNINGRVAETIVDKNLFRALNGYYRIAYSHNPFAHTLLKQFQPDLEELIPRESLLLKSYDVFISNLFQNDDDIASISWIRNMKVDEEGSAYSLFFSHLYETLQNRKIENLKPRFPRGLPTLGEASPYLLEDAVDALGKRLSEIPQPFMAYFHFMPPHHPYRTSREFFDAFKGDGFKPIEKPIDVLAPQKISQEQPRRRTEYDEFILYCDQQFGRLYDRLESSGMLENTWLVLTSDHGEMFERGISGHGSKVLYQPVIRIPLLIFEPGREAGLHVHTPTSAVDVLPTLAHLTGQRVPDWSEGVILPPYATTLVDSDRSLYALQAIENPPDAPLSQASTMLVKGEYKLHYYFGYPEAPDGELVKLFNIKSDPEELTDLASSKKGIASELLQELKSKLKEVNQPYL